MRHMMVSDEPVSPASSLQLGVQSPADLYGADIDPNTFYWVNSRDTHDWGEITRHIASQTRYVVVMTHRLIESELHAALSVGAKGYCHVSCSENVLNAVTQAVQSGGIWIPKELLSLTIHKLAAHERFTPANGLSSLLTEREKAVVNRILMGMSNLAIAEALFITERTVKQHVTTILKKYDVKDRVALLLKLGTFKQLE